MVYLHYEIAPAKFSTIPWDSLSSHDQELFLQVLRWANVWHKLSSHAPWDNPQIDAFSN